LSAIIERMFRAADHRRVPLTLWVGAGIVVVCEVLLFVDVLSSGRAPVRSDAQILSLPRPVGVVQTLGRIVAPNMTPLAWLGYILFLDGLLAIQRSGSPLRRRPHHFAMLCLASIPIWCVFDVFNFYSIKAWDYIGIPPHLGNRILGYFIAFASIVPGMLMSGQMLINFGCFRWAQFRRWPRMPAAVLWISLIGGIVMLIWPMIHHDPITNLTLWTSLVFLLDPINYRLGRPSMWRDWQNGWYGRTLALFAGGLLCGFLWEFWNYWALSKWIYHLPFLGTLEQYRYFEMPLLGLLGFLPFGIECWVMWQLIRVPLDGLVEALPDERTLM
jgi:hypothetical protein